MVVGTLVTSAGCRCDSIIRAVEVPGQSRWSRLPGPNDRWPPGPRRDTIGREQEAIIERMSSAQAASAQLPELMARLGSSADGLSSVEATSRLTAYGPNAIRTHHVSALAVLRRQLNNAVLLLLAGTAVLSAFLGDDTQSIIIGIILVVSIGLGFVNEYRAERATEALHSRVRHTAVVRRDGDFVKVDVTELVPATSSG